MINIEDAMANVRKAHFNVDNPLKEIEKAVYEIYNSIGSCGECKSYSKADGLCSAPIGVNIYRIPSFYCADFEKKND